LGSLSGLYEIAIDALCSHNGAPPKIVGSTATIRRATVQIRRLFNRRSFQFPPPGIDSEDSFFAALEIPTPEKPTLSRAFVGITTAGRSPKFTLQAVCASLLQGAAGLSGKDEEDLFWTLVAYFNSLRELGGALVMMQDDVGDSLKLFAERNGEEPRKSLNLTELSSRVASREIPEIIDNLESKKGSENCFDSVLASNMISVGVDFPRVNMMVVSGQPKGISEYIQATSRVGRQNPGLVVTVFNNNKVRDRAHYETFCTWHSALYRDIEATSVTPFASRARDKALHAVFIALVRHLVSGMETSPGDLNKYEKEIGNIKEIIIQRVRDISENPKTAEAVTKELDRFIDDWRKKGRVSYYWNDWNRKNSLLVSAELAAALLAGGRYTDGTIPTPNSMREVEPAVEFVLTNKLRENKRKI